MTTNKNQHSHRNRYNYNRHRQQVSLSEYVADVIRTRDAELERYVDEIAKILADEPATPEPPPAILLGKFPLETAHRIASHIRKHYKVHVTVLGLATHSERERNVFLAGKTPAVKIRKVKQYIRSLSYKE